MSGQTTTQRGATALRTYQDAMASTVAALLPRMTERYELDGNTAAITLALALTTNAAALCAGAVSATFEDGEKLRDRIQSLMVEWLAERGELPARWEQPQ